MNNRYSRQELFSPIGEEGQRKIREKHVLIIGAGALGSANAEMFV
ncbi:ThiF family adenylyltransferase, partial [Klebsiella pneumoniae]